MRACEQDDPAPVAYPGSVLTGMRDKTGGPRTRYRLLALLIALGMLVSAAPLVVPLVSSVLDGLRG